jgi:ankyrin repeat protein
MKQKVLLVLFTVLVSSIYAQENNKIIGDLFKKRNKGTQSTTDLLVFNDDYAKNGDLKANGFDYFLLNVLPTNDTATIHEAMKNRGYSFNKLLADPINDDNAWRSNNSILLLVVIDKCNANTLKFFLDHGANPNLRAVHTVYNHFTGSVSGTYYSRYPLEAACNLKDTAKMNLLIRYGANISVVAEKLKKVAYESEDFGFMEYIRVITGGTLAEDILLQIIQSAFQREKLTPELIADFVKKGAGINVKGDGGATLLMCAISKKLPIPCIKEIIKQGANVNTGSPKTGVAPAHYPITLAVNYNNLEVVKLLIESGALFNVIGGDFKGYPATPLGIATAHGFKEIAAYLYAKGAN